MNYLLVLANASIPEMSLVVVTEERPVSFIRSLDTTGLPLPYSCLYAVESESVTMIGDIEKTINGIFPDTKVRDTRDFYRINPNVVKRFLSFLVDKKLVEETSIDSGEIECTPADRDALERQERRSRFRFAMTGLAIGTHLTFTDDATITATIATDTEVEYEGEKLSTSTAAIKAFAKINKIKTSLAGPLYWEYNGKTLDEWRTSNEALFK